MKQTCHKNWANFKTLSVCFGDVSSCVSWHLNHCHCPFMPFLSFLRFFQFSNIHPDDVSSATDSYNSFASKKDFQPVARFFCKAVLSLSIQKVTTHPTSHLQNQHSAGIIQVLCYLCMEIQSESSGLNHVEVETTLSLQNVKTWV